MYLADKQFTCGVEGCGMKFLSEDSLHLHIKKHDMVLNIGSKGNIFADQTPTPTRFIRNCEEVGLFQDLQNVNPFEETFKKAAEAVKSGNTSTLLQRFPSCATDDTLHTPNVFPHLVDVSLANLNIDRTDSAGVKDLISITTGDIDKAINFIKSERVPEIKTLDFLNTTDAINKSSGSDKNKVVVVMRVPGGKFVQFRAEQVSSLSNVDNESVFVNTNCENSSVKHVLKEKLLKSLDSAKRPVENYKVPIPRLINQQTSSFKCFAGTPKTITRNMTKIKQKRKDESHRALVDDFKDRNRAAALRSRLRKKNYIKRLETTNAALSLSNKQLETVNTALIKENKMLKAILAGNTYQVKDLTSLTLVGNQTVNTKLEKQVANVQQTVDCNIINLGRPIQEVIENKKLKPIVTRNTSQAKDLTSLTFMGNQTVNTKLKRKKANVQQTVDLGLQEVIGKRKLKPKSTRNTSQAKDLTSLTFMGNQTVNTKLKRKVANVQQTVDCNIVDLGVQDVVENNILKSILTGNTSQYKNLTLKGNQTVNAKLERQVANVQPTVDCNLVDLDIQEVVVVDCEDSQVPYTITNGGTKRDLVGNVTISREHSYFDIA